MSTTLFYRDCLKLDKVDRLYHVTATEINPSTGKAYAYRPDGIWDDEYFARTYANNPANNYGRPGSTISFEDTVKRAIEMNKEANKPAVESLEASIPEQAKKFTNQRSQLEAEKQPLKERYDSLLSQIKGNQTTAENRQTVTTNNELGKRGLLPASGLAQQEMTNALNPITAQYTGLYKDTGLAQEADFRDIGNQITSSFDKETEANRSVRNAIAQLMSGAAGAGISQGMGQYQFEEGQAQQRRLADQQAASEAAQRAISNQIAQAQLANETRQVDYAVGKPYYKESGGGGGSSISSILGGAPSVPKPTYKPTANPVSRYSYLR